LPGITAEPLQSLSAQADLYFNASSKIQFHKRINSFFCWLDNVDQALVRANFVLVARILVYVRRDQNVNLSLRVGNGIGPNLRACTSCSLNNFLSRGIDQLVIEGFKTNPNALVLHG